MALQPSLSPMVIAGPSNAPHTLDIFLDYVCPFSAKLARTMNSVLKPWFDKGGKYHGKVKLIMRLQVQPFHVSSMLTHEAGLAVIRASPDHFWAYSLKLFDEQGDFFDIPASTLTPLQIREKLAVIAEAVFQDKGKVEEFKELLKHKTTPHGGVAVTNDLKYTIKFSRQNGIHVSPTTLWDGLIVQEIDSSWGEEQWSKFLSEKVSV